MVGVFHRRALVIGALGAAAAFATPACGQAPRLFDDEETLERLTTEYNDIIVRRVGGTVYLMFVVGRCDFAQSAYRPSDPTYMPFAYTRTITAALAYPPRLGSMLEIGLGGGRTAMYLKDHVKDLQITSVDIDPGVVAIAKRHFGVVEDDRLRLVVADGRKHLQDNAQKHDLITIDAYRGTWVPETLTTVEFFTLVKSRLNPGGAVAQNVEPTTLLFDGMLATLRAVFDRVDVYPTGGEESNVVLVAHDGAAKSRGELRARAAALQARWGFRHNLPEILASREAAPRALRAEPLRDGFDRANTLLMIDRANDRDTPRQRSQRCKA